MSIENSLEGLNLSPSVLRVAEKYLEHESVAPAQVINDLLEQHPDYGGGLAGRTHLSEELTRGTAPIDRLLGDAADLFVDRLDLHTRIAVIGLVLNAELIVGATALLLPALAGELHEPLESILTKDGLKRWKELGFDRTAPSASAGPANAVGTGDSPAQNAQSAAPGAKDDPSGGIAQQASSPAASPEQVRTALRALA